MTNHPTLSERQLDLTIFLPDGREAHFCGIGDEYLWLLVFNGDKCTLDMDVPDWELNKYMRDYLDAPYGVRK